MPVRPGRATRRAPLALRWTGPVLTSRGVVPELHIELVNTASELWINHADDRSHVAGWVCDLAGEHVAESPPWVVTTGTATLPDLEPGQRTDLPVNLDPSGLDLPAGRYQLEAVLLGLDLHGRLTALEITRAENAPP